MGLATHYLTGVVLTEAYFVLARRAGSRPGLGSATTCGAATALLPCLVLYPSWGYGWFALRSGEARRLVGSMLLGHAVFGAAIGVWAAALSKRGGASRTPGVTRRTG